MSEVNVNETMREVATLVVFSARTWGARVQDTTVVARVAREAEAKTNNVGTFSKRLLAGADEEFKELTAKINEARRLHYAMTLPYTRGQALLPNTQMLDYIKRMNQIKQEILTLRDQFKAVYPQRKQRAMQKLGKLADPTKYPPVDAIDYTFGIDIEFLPIPMAQDFSYLPDGFAEKLGMDLEQKLKDRTEQAKQFGWQRLGEALEHAAEKCLDPDTKRFFKTMIEHVDDAARLMRGFTEENSVERGILERVLSATAAADIKQIRSSETAKLLFGNSCKEAFARLRELHLVDTAQAPE